MNLDRIAHGEASNDHKAATERVNAESRTRRHPPDDVEDSRMRHLGALELVLMRGIGSRDDDRVGPEPEYVSRNIAAALVTPTVADIVGELAASGEERRKQADENLLKLIHRNVVKAKLGVMEGWLR